jgi:putative flavoprotein involved in K+ transport
VSEDVLVIGAGPAGIAAAYYLQKAGIPYKVIDEAQEIASTWNSLYPSLRLNTSRFFSHLPERKFPLHYGLFPTAKQYHHYLEQYVQDYDLNIHLGVTVERVYPDGPGWRVESQEGTMHHNEWYPAVISATGRFGAPVQPHFSGEETFSGEIIHANRYLGPEPFTGQRVMVVGNGPSGVDIATELGRTEGVVKPVLLSQRTGVVLRPRYPWGLPKHVWMMIGEKLPDVLAKPLMDKILSARFDNLDEVGIKSPQGPEESSAAGGTRGRELIEVVKAGAVVSVDGPQRFEGDDVILDDDSRVQPHTVIMATGYKPVLWRYLEIDVPTDNDGWPLRIDEPFDRVMEGKRQVVGYPGLYLVGVFYQGKGAMYNFNTESADAVQEIKAHLHDLKSRSAVIAGD